MAGKPRGARAAVKKLTKAHVNLKWNAAGFRSAQKDGKSFASNEIL